MPRGEPKARMNVMDAGIVEYDRMVDSDRRRGDRIYRNVVGHEFNLWVRRGGRDVGIPLE